MLTLLATLGLLGLTLLLIAVQKTYQDVPPKELKRRARAHDELAMLLYKAAAYGMSLELLLWLLLGLAGAGLFVLLSAQFVGWMAFLITFVILFLGFSWLPTQPVSRWAGWLASRLAAPLAWLLERIHPILDWFARVIRLHRPISFHTGLYQKEDLLDLIQQQKIQIDNRMTEEELRIATHALTFGDTVIRQVMTPRRMMKKVKAEDAVGPILLTELHDSGHSRFPVVTKDHKVVGTLLLRDLVGVKAGGKISAYMRQDVYYVNESASLEQALHAFLRTKHHLFIVINEFEETVGLITIEDVLERIIGKQIVDEFDQYDDLRAVATSQAKEDRKDAVGSIVE